MEFQYYFRVFYSIKFFFIAVFKLLNFLLVNNNISKIIRFFRYLLYCLCAFSFVLFFFHIFLFRFSIVWRQWWQTIYEVSPKSMKTLKKR